MSEHEIVLTSGKGMDALKAYFAYLGDSNLPRKLPAESKWQNDATYDAPHGLVRVQSDGRWEARFAVLSVAQELERRGFTVECFMFDRATLKERQVPLT